LTEEYNKKLRENEILGNIINDELDVITRGENPLELKCIKKFSSMSDEMAQDKMIKWLEAKKDNHQISEYNIDSMEFDSFYETLVEKGLDKILNYPGN
jgi:hypothetical protein